MYDQLSEIAPTVMIQLEALNWKEDIRTLAQVFGREDAADQWISAYEEKQSVLHMERIPVICYF